MNSEFLGFLRRHGIAFNDRSRKVELVVDEATSNAAAVQLHPLVNTATLVISREHLARFLSLTGHEPRVMLIPPDTAAPAAVSERAAD